VGGYSGEESFGAVILKQAVGQGSGGSQGVAPEIRHQEWMAWE
jgi:hypothetical protein